MRPTKHLRLPSGIFERDGAEQMFVFCLPSAGRDALLAMTERFYWSIWVDEDGNRVSLPDEQIAILEATEAELLGGMNLDEIGNGLDELISLLEGMELDVQINNHVNNC